MTTRSDPTRKGISRASKPTACSKYPFDHLLTMPTHEPDPSTEPKDLIPFLPPVELVPLGLREVLRLQAWCVVFVIMAVMRMVVHSVSSQPRFAIDLTVTSDALLVVIAALLAVWMRFRPGDMAAVRRIAVAVYMTFCVQLLFGPGIASIAMDYAIWTVLLIMATPALLPTRTWVHGVLVSWPCLLVVVAVVLSHLGVLFETSTGNRLLLLVVILLSSAIALLISSFEDRLMRTQHLLQLRLRQIAGYQLVRRLGYGGMGEVWKAHHGVLKRDVAIKIISPEHLPHSLMVDEMTDRFEREARAMVNLTSPHTVQIFDYGRSESGAFYYVMEYLHGTDLERLVMREGRQPQARVRNFLLQLCEALAEAHAINIIHRDIKPSNIICCQLGQKIDFIKVLDYGLAVNAPTSKEGNPLHGNVRLTASGYINGTPLFIAPEQINNAIIDARCDIYGIGLVAYWLLAGHAPFSGSEPELLKQHQFTPPPPIDSRHGKLVPAFSTLVARCLAKRPDERPPDCMVLAEQLRHLPIKRWTSEHLHLWDKAQRNKHIASQAT